MLAYFTKKPSIPPNGDGLDGAIVYKFMQIRGLYSRGTTMVKACRTFHGSCPSRFI